MEKRLLREVKTAGEFRGNKLDALNRQLDALSPLKVMSRGYSILYDGTDKKIIRSIKDVQIGDMLKVRIQNGKLDCQVRGMGDVKSEQNN